MKSKLLTYGGLLLLAAALCLCGYNTWDSYRAAQSASGLAAQIEEKIEKTTEELAVETDSIGGTGEMPVVQLDGQPCVGRLEIPALELSLPVLNEWSYPNLKISPCRYKGTVSLDNMIIAAHNYKAHFGRLKELDIGEEVIFTDMTGKAFQYTVAEIDILPSTAIAEMEAGEWDLTLFTCTADGKARLTVRCMRSNHY